MVFLPLGPYIPVRCIFSIKYRKEECFFRGRYNFSLTVNQYGNRSKSPSQIPSRPAGPPMLPALPAVGLSRSGLAFCSKQKSMAWRQRCNKSGILSEFLVVPHSQDSRRHAISRLIMSLKSQYCDLRQTQVTRVFNDCGHMICHKWFPIARNTVVENNC